MSETPAEMVQRKCTVYPLSLPFRKDGTRCRRSKSRLTFPKLLVGAIAPMGHTPPKSFASAPVTVDLDGAAGYAASFLEEAFGGLARRLSAARVKERLRLVSTEQPELIDEINGFIDDMEQWQ